MVLMGFPSCAQADGVILVLKSQHQGPFIGTTDGQLCIQLTDLGLLGMTGVVNNRPPIIGVSGAIMGHSGRMA